MIGKNTPLGLKGVDWSGVAHPPEPTPVHPVSPSARSAPSVVICLRALGTPTSGRRNVSPLTPTVMANPRYVDRDDVDSSAMLGAAAHSLHLDRQLWETIGVWGRLPITLHWAGHFETEEIIIPPGFYALKCKEGTNCTRCATGRGGYKFRWFSPLWTQAYVAGARKGAWLPGQPETRYRKPAVALQTGGSGANLGAANGGAPVEAARGGTTAAHGYPTPEERAAAIYAGWDTIVANIANATCEDPSAAPLDTGTTEQLLLQALDEALNYSAPIVDPRTAVRSRTSAPPPP